MTKKKTAQKFGVIRENRTDKAYMATIILNYPDHMGDIETQTIYDEKGLDIWLDTCKGKVTGIQIIYTC